MSINRSTIRPLLKVTHALPPRATVLWWCAAGGFVACGSAGSTRGGKVTFVFFFGVAWGFKSFE